jgi:hypothetical protein
MYSTNIMAQRPRKVAGVVYVDLIGEKRNAYKDLVGQLKEEGNLQDLGTGGRTL